MEAINENLTLNTFINIWLYNVVPIKPKTINTIKTILPSIYLKFNFEKNILKFVKVDNKTPLPNAIRAVYLKNSLFFNSVFISFFKL